MRKLEISSAELGDKNLLKEFDTHNQININVPRHHANILTSSWDKYASYHDAKNSKPTSLVTALKGMRWLLHRAVMDLKYPSLQQINELYLEKSGLLEPVELKEEGGSIKLCFRKNKTRKPGPDHSFY